MTELKRLEISGIRSFKANPTNIDSQSIDFDGPITLITGENGTGKTTIIEALKFATMGKCTEEMVTDPSIWGKDGTESRVSLIFKSANQNTYKITLTPSVKKNQNTKKEKSFKKGDCEVTMTTPEGHQKVSHINSKDIENQVPNYFGVSPPIIENVIFCHQKDSCWPIDCSTRDLKEKFDQIFGAEKYNAAIKALKDTLKNLKEKLVQVNLEVTRQNERQESYLKCEKKIFELKRNLIELENEVQEKETLFDEVDAPVKEYNKIKPEVDQINQAIQKLSGQMQFEKKSIDDLEKKIKNLQSKETCDFQLKSIDESIKSSEINLEQSKNLLSSKRAEQKTVEQEIKDISVQVQSLDKKLKSAESEHNFYMQKLEEFKNKYNDENLEVILNQKMQALAQSETDLESLDANKDCISKKDTEVRNKEQSLHMESSQLSSLEKKLADYQNELLDIREFDEQKLNEAKGKYESLNNELKNFGITDSQELENKVDVTNEKKKLLEKQKEELVEKSKKCKVYADLNKELQIKDDQINKANESIEFHLGIIRDELNDTSIELENVKQTLDTKCSQLTTEMENLSIERKQINNEFISVSQQHKSEESSYNKNKDSAEKAKHLIDKVLKPGESYEAALKFAEDCLQEENDKLSKLRQSKDVYTGFKKDAEKVDQDGDYTCPLCKRKFKDHEECTKFIEENLEQYIKDLPIQIKKTERTKEMFESDVKKLKEIENSVQIYENFQNNKDSCEEQIKSLSHKKEELGKQLQEKQNEIASIENKLKKLNKLSTNVEFLNEAIKEKNKAFNDKNAISLKIDKNFPSFEEIQNEIEEKEKQIGQLSEAINLIYSEQARLTKEKSQLSTKVQKYKDEYDALKDANEKRQILCDKIENTKNSIGAQKEKVETLQSEVKELKFEFTKLSEDYEKQFKEKSDNKTNARDELKDCKDLIGQIQKSRNILEELGSGDKSKELQELKDMLDEKSKKRDQYSDDIDKLTTEITNLSTTISNLKNDEMNLKSQKEYFVKKENFEALEKQLSDWENKRTRKLGNLEKMDIQSLIERQKQYNNDLVKAKTNMSNVQQQLEEEKKTAEEYAPSRKLLSEATIRYKSTEYAISDITRYIQALDKTILDYHSQKMAEINDTIQYLWSNTYFGQDIDTIYIRCEEEKAKNAQYNYRVVMKKNNIELDMDRRCSAGQKMLASIIIRLALAQTFALNCGIIALDEPTTNLDEPNRKNLANQLIDLVNAQEKDNSGAIKKPFQLIIITHNREFVESLVEEGTLDCFYQITRVIDDSHHCSQIKKCSETNLVVRH